MNDQPVDDATAAYILATRRYFEDLRQVAAQLAGLLVLAAAGGKSATPDHPMLESAAQLHQEAWEGIRTVRPSRQAQVHCDWMIEAGGSLAAALSSARRGLVDIDSVLIPLRAAYGQLQQAAGTLPGFEMVAFEQACGCLGSRR